MSSNDILLDLINNAMAYAVDTGQFIDVTKRPVFVAVLHDSSRLYLSDSGKPGKLPPVSCVNVDTDRLSLSAPDNADAFLAPVLSVRDAQDPCDSQAKT